MLSTLNITSSKARVVHNSYSSHIYYLFILFHAKASMQLHDPYRYYLKTFKIFNYTNLKQKIFNIIF